MASPDSPAPCIRDQVQGRITDLTTYCSKNYTIATIVFQNGGMTSGEFETFRKKWEISQEQASMYLYTDVLLRHSEEKYCQMALEIYNGTYQASTGGASGSSAVLPGTGIGTPTQTRNMSVTSVASFGFQYDDGVKRSDFHMNYSTSSVGSSHHDSSPQITASEASSHSGPVFPSAFTDALIKNLGVVAADSRAGHGQLALASSSPAPQDDRRQYAASAPSSPSQTSHQAICSSENDNHRQISTKSADPSSSWALPPGSETQASQDPPRAQPGIAHPQQTRNPPRGTPPTGNLAGVEDPPGNKHSGMAQHQQTADKSVLAEHQRTSRQEGIAQQEQENGRTEMSVHVPMPASQGDKDQQLMSMQLGDQPQNVVQPITPAQLQSMPQLQAGSNERWTSTPRQHGPPSEVTSLAAPEGRYPETDLPATIAQRSTELSTQPQQSTDAQLSTQRVPSARQNATAAAPVASQPTVSTYSSPPLRGKRHSSHSENLFVGNSVSNLNGDERGFKEEPAVAGKNGALPMTSSQRIDLQRDGGNSRFELPTKSFSGIHGGAQFSSRPNREVLRSMQQLVCSLFDQITELQQQMYPDDVLQSAAARVSSGPATQTMGRGRDSHGYSTPGSQPPGPNRNSQMYSNPGIQPLWPDQGSQMYSNPGTQPTRHDQDGQMYSNPGTQPTRPDQDGQMYSNPGTQPTRHDQGSRAYSTSTVRDGETSSSKHKGNVARARFLDLPHTLSPAGDEATPSGAISEFTECMKRLLSSIEQLRSNVLSVLNSSRSMQAVTDISTPEQGLGAGNRPNLDFSASPIPAAMSNADIYPHSPANRNLGGGDKTGISAQSSMESGLGLMSSVSSCPDPPKLELYPCEYTDISESSDVIIVGSHESNQHADDCSGCPMAGKPEVVIEYAFGSDVSVMNVKKGFSFHRVCGYRFRCPSLRHLSERDRYKVKFRVKYAHGNQSKWKPFDRDIISASC